MRISDWSSDVCSSDLIVGLSIRQRWFVLAIVGLLCALGVWSAFRLPVDAVPDITNVQVQINTEAEGYSPLESEQRITFPLETDRKSVVEGKGVAERVDRGGRRIIKKKTKRNKQNKIK